ncbi:MAG: alkaline phosphatase family protein [Bacillota bacterium]|nr:alkaline phosphatase family protein [Bacillota bacterium]
MKMIFIFVDGFGLGEDDPAKNPICASDAKNLEYIFKNFKVIPTETTLGVKGLPQSATGQTAIFTGVNAPGVLGRHMNGQPTVTLKEILNRNNLFKELQSKGYRVTNFNVYRTEYLEKMNDPRERRYRPSATSVMTMSAGIPFRMAEDYDSGNGIYHDITGRVLREYGYDIDLISPEEGAQRLYKGSSEYDFTLFEHFMPDIIGHSMNMEDAKAEILLLDKFLGELVRVADLEDTIIFITSDHGNIEDISVKTHTFNRVPTILISNMPCVNNIKIESLLDITPAVLQLFEMCNAKTNRS